MKCVGILNKNSWFIQIRQHHQDSWRLLNLHQTLVCRSFHKTVINPKNPHAHQKTHHQTVFTQIFETVLWEMVCVGCVMGTKPDFVRNGDWLHRGIQVHYKERSLSTPSMAILPSSSFRVNCSFCKPHPEYELSYTQAKVAISIWNFHVSFI